MDVLQPKVDSIGGEVSQISDALRAYLEHGLVSGRKVQPPKTKASRDLLQHLLGRLDQVSLSLNDIRRLTASPSPSPQRQPPTTNAPVPLTPTPTASKPQPLPTAVTGAPGPAENSEERQDDDHVSTPTVPPALPSVGADRTLVQPGTQIVLSDGSVYAPPILVENASPLFDCTYQDIHVLNEELFELYSSHPIVRELGYLKLQVRGLPPLNVQHLDRPTKDHATSFCYRVDHLGLVKVDTGKRFKFSPPSLPLPLSAKTHWSLDEQRDLWNSSAADPPKGNCPYIIGNPLFDDVELSPGEKLRRRGRTVLEGINTQYIYFNLTGKTITTMHREDAHVRSENLLRSGQHKFWCFVKPAFSKKLEERMAAEYPEMRRCSQAVRHLSRHIPPAKLDEWGIEYTLDYCVPGQAVITEPGTYHQVLNLGPNYAIAINLEYESSPDMPPDYTFCDKNCPDKFAMNADDFRIYDTPPPPRMPRTPEASDGEHVPATSPDETADAQTQSSRSGTPPPDDPAVQPHQQLTPASSDTHDHDSPSFPAPQSEPTQAEASGPPPTGPLCGALGVPAAPGSRSEQACSEPSTKAETTSPQAPPQELSSAAPFSIDRFEPVTTPSGTPTMPSQTKQDTAPGPIAILQQAVARAVLQHSPPSQAPVPSALAPQPPAPLRKTARMINPEREDLMPDPRPRKKQRPEPIIAPKMNNAPVAVAGVPRPNPHADGVPVPSQPTVPGAADTLASATVSSTALPAQAPGNAPLGHLSILLRECEASKPGATAAAKISGKPAFERLAHLVREWRRYARSAPIAIGGFGLVQTLDETEKDYPELHMFLLRLFKMELSKCIEAATSRSGNLPPQNFMSGMLQSLGWIEAGRPKLQDYLREGKCWTTLCGSREGLLSLIPPGVDWLDLALYRNEVERFHAELNDPLIDKLCSVGQVLQRAIWRCLELPEFIFETAITTWLRADQLPPLLDPFRLIKSNVFDPSSAETATWPRPVGWDWAWPSDPTAARPGDVQCSFCPRKTCRCADAKIPQVPRISDDRSRGGARGIRSLGTHRKGQILGELVGELVLPGSRPGEWTLPVRRPDLGGDEDAPPVAEIWPRRMGNWVRMVRHCGKDPAAAFRVMKISGRWRQVLVTLRDVGDGEEITARYGRGYTGDQPYEVVEGLR
ncbi:hypothetical protein VTJ04DRAFT_2376 [Mycothermus thermophilus]|uniref:uncharacterized protein n=1 Tax=Humicola insolens TaxID=85995 RepID=UPI003742331E